MRSGLKYIPCCVAKLVLLNEKPKPAKSLSIHECPFTYPASSERNPHSDYPFDIVLKDNSSGKENGRYSRQNNGVRSVERKDVLLDSEKRTGLHTAGTTKGSEVRSRPIQVSSVCGIASNRQDKTHRTPIKSNPWLRTKVGGAPARPPRLEKRNRYSGYQFTD